MEVKREAIAQGAALELHNGDYVSFGIGLPTLIVNHPPANLEILLQSGNSMSSIGLYSLEDEVDSDQHLQENCLRDADANSIQMQLSLPASTSIALFLDGTTKTYRGARDANS